MSGMHREGGKAIFKAVKIPGGSEERQSISRIPEEKDASWDFPHAPWGWGSEAVTSEDGKAGDNPLQPPAEISACSKFSSGSCSFPKAGSRGEGSARAGPETFPATLSSARGSGSRTGRCVQNKGDEMM